MNVTLDNVKDVIHALGCEPSDIVTKGEWQRVYIKAPAPSCDGEPVQIGRYMFHNGEFKWGNFYLNLLDGGPLHWADRYAYNYWLLGNGLPILTDAAWSELCRKSMENAQAHYQTKRDARRATNEARVSQGKKPNNRRLTPPNERAQAFKILSESKT